MSCPLYKRMKKRGTSFYAFPSAVADLSNSFQNDSFKFNFTKFALLNLKRKDNNLNILDFNDLYSQGNTTPFYQATETFAANQFSDMLIESFRNYIANYDANIREAKITTNKDFYDNSVNKTVTEAVFWKWCRKMNLMDLEPAVHNVDWDKNNPDFNNPNGSTTSNLDYFREYLWKERETINYNCVITQGSGNKPTITIPGWIKFRNGDNILLTGATLQGGLSGGTNYIIENVITNSGTSVLTLTYNNYIYSNPQNCIIKLNYSKLIQYIGEINAVSKVSTAKKNYTEISAFIPAHVGKTPTILFRINDTTNYYPSLEVPILTSEIQSEILGAENLDSPIRTTPTNYPGNWYGIFDTMDKTYKCNTGDKIRKKGDYYGIKLTNNTNLNNGDYFEKLNDFDSRNIDGLNLDFDLNHYFKFNNRTKSVGFNFDEFNTMSFNNLAPEDFDYNTILWYYEVEDSNGNMVTNLFGVTFLNNPENDDDILNDYITPYKKLVSNGLQDGLSYQHNLDLNIETDNDMLPAMYDPQSIYDAYNFDLYNKVMSNIAKTNENMINMVDTFVNMNDKLNTMEKLIYSQTDMDLIKEKINNLENLLTLYKNNQFVETDTVKIVTNYSGNYPTIQFDVKSVDYGKIINLKASDIYNYINSNAKSYSIDLLNTNKMLININNDDVINYGNMSFIIERDLQYKQILEINVFAEQALRTSKIDININYDDGNNNGYVLNKLYTLNLPANLLNDDPIIWSKVKYTNSVVYKNVDYIKSLDNGKTELNISQNIFGEDDGSIYLYIDNLVFLSGNTTKDYSGVYEVSNIDWNDILIRIDLNTYGLTCVSLPVVYLYRGMKLKITRINDNPKSLITERYFIEKVLF